ncbi:MAG: cache domain-containing protein, partial [Leptothrix sp. (in: b-proteobacteria)]
ATDSITDAATAPDWRGAEAAPGHGSIEVLQPAQLAALAPQLSAQVAVPLVDTADGLRVNPLDGTPPGSAHPAPRLETRAMVLLASRAVRDESGRLIGHVQAGVLLNRNLTFIDQINAIVYPEGSLPFGSRGTATLFLDDVRISTNVRLFGPEPDQRAIGTRVSAAVRERVLGRGQTWLDRAYVVSDWYVSAYQPLLGGAGQRIGMLYVGYLEAPFTRLKYGVLGGIGLVFFAVMGIATALSLRWARAIFRPVEQMEATMRQIEAGVPGARVGAVGSDDEIGRLARHLDRLLDGLDEQTRALQRGNAELDAKVAQRTRELATAQTQLLRSEKLAAVGQLTASVAHEINNPIAVMQGNLDLLRSQLPSATAALVRTELRLLDAQIERMRLIVMQLLQFARPGEYAGYVVPVALGPLIDDSLELTAHLRTPAITLQRDLQATREPAINRNELQQVLVNLLVNAIDAMPDGGTLTLRTRDVDADRVALSVIDSGSGLDAALMDQLFQPFVTRKKDGTGLGLWISRSLVERHGGDLQGANRRDGRGAAFTLLLRIEA